MPNFDDFKLAIEAMTGGKNTVLFDDMGMPSVMVPFPKMKIAEIMSGGSQNIHPAFSVGGVEKEVKTIKVSLITAFCLLFVGFACFEFIPQVLLGMFSASDDMLQIGVPALRIIGVHFLIAWFCIIVGTVFQALGKAVFSMIVSIMRQLVVLIPAAYILSKLGGLHAVWWAFPIAEVISFTVSTLFLIRINRTVISKIPDGSDVL